MLDPDGSWKIALPDYEYYKYCKDKHHSTVVDDYVIAVIRAKCPPMMIYRLNSRIKTINIEGEGFDEPCDFCGIIPSYNIEKKWWISEHLLCESCREQISRVSFDEIEHGCDEVYVSTYGDWFACKFNEKIMGYVKTIHKWPYSTEHSALKVYLSYHCFELWLIKMITQYVLPVELLVEIIYNYAMCEPKK